ncbi:MAG: CooT family nickel-binding protein [Syntrophobacterales bacterium]|nr:MAG: CooT family nickel-binding protein [Syntrophobacterales bacterium]
MCQSTAYIVKEGKEQVILSDIISVKPTGTHLRLINLFGEEATVEASIEEVDLLNHRIKLRPR